VTTPLQPPQIGIIAASESPVTASLGLLVEAVGGGAQIMTPLEAGSGSSRDCFYGYIVHAEALDMGHREQAATLLAALSAKPVLIYGLGQGSRVLDVIQDVYHLCLRTVEPAPTRNYRFTTGERMLWPFAGTVLAEADDRLLATVRGDATGFQPLISTPAAGAVFARFSDRSRELFLSAADDWPGGPPVLLRRAFWASRFLNTLPVLVFARHLLGERGWTKPRCQATAIVDDPNLRGLRYGHLRFQEAVDQARAHNFHLSIGFVPLDYRRSSASVAQLFRDNPMHVSLVMHGNDHLQRELARPVSPAEADFAVRQALARMDRHQQLTGLACPPVMTLPHGDCTLVWVRALRDAGYSAAIAGRLDAFLDPPGTTGSPPLHEMVPAEMGIFGFPLLSRLSLAQPLHELLFAAWLGKPLIVYTHHDFFSEGWDNFLQAIDFINRQIDPEWVDVGTMVGANYQIRTVGGTAEVRAFSNDVSVDIGPGVEDLVCTKDGRDIPWESEVVTVDGAVVRDAECSPNGVRVSVSALPRASRVKVHFASTLGQVRPFPGWERTRFKSRVRRLVTETRDRLDGRLAVKMPAAPRR
jgi:hypothetical protein